MYRFAQFTVIAALACWLVGCQDSNSAAPALATVSGTINLDGKAMGGGEIRFSVPGRPVKSIAIKDGAFTGEVFVGKNHIDIVWDQDGPPNPTDPNTRMKVNIVSPMFSSPQSNLTADIEAKGTTGLKFDVTSIRR